MNLRQMEVFRAIMLTGSIAGAAELLHISQSAVSKMLSHTQQRMSLKLFELVKGRLVPTSEARELYEEVERLWRNVEKVHALSQELANPSKGNLYIAASPSLGMTVVPHSVADTVKERPELRVKVILPLPNALIDVVAEKIVDIGITTFEVSHPSIHVHARYTCPLVCIMAPGHPLAALREIRPYDLVGHRLISVPLQELYGLSEDKVYGEVLEDLNIGLEVRSGLIASLFSRASGEVAVVDAIAISDQLMPELVIRPFVTPERIDIAVIQNRYKPLSPQALLFQNLLMQRLELIAREWSA
ncbi:MAG: Octopine catabolism/uptake operon regulatory protein OccR [Stenotrophomonas maltophilia]|nr:MAG: Octopine catabolism/uptake operon regulatory protein OccR [Stenotrophomonas maltophilia]